MFQILKKMGLGNIQDFDGIKKVENQLQLMQLLLKNLREKTLQQVMGNCRNYIRQTHFSATFPQGFPAELIDKFIKGETNCGGILLQIALPAKPAIIEKLR